MAAVTAITGVVACRQIADISDSPPEKLATSTCGLAYGTSTCAACVNASCCAPSMACAADPACSAYENCLGPCNGDPACRSRCTIDHPAGAASDVSALSACVASKCEALCGLTCGGMTDLISAPDAAAACQQCLQTSACAQAQTCASSQPCDAYMRSTLAFGTLDSVEAFEQLQCASSDAAGLSLDIGGRFEVCGKTPQVNADAGLSSRADAFRFTCTTPCETGNYWACAGHVSWPPPKASTSTIELVLTDYVTNLPVAGATARVCSPTDVPNCSEPLQQGTSDANGLVSLTFPNAAAINMGLNGFVRITSPDIVTQDIYWGFPLVESSLFLTQQVVTPAEDQQLLDSVHVTPESARGQLDLYASDCLYQAAPGVQVVLTPSDMLTQGFSSGGSQTTVTDQKGLLFFVNAPAGETQITATPPALGKPSSQISVNVQPGNITFVFLFPTPNP